MLDATLILLPGLHGTGALLQPLRDAIGDDAAVRTIEYPVDTPLSYDALLVIIAEQVSVEGPIVLIAESYSGPLALRLAAESPDRVRAVILCASFARSPLPCMLRRLVRPSLFKLPLPSLFLRSAAVGWSAPSWLVAGLRDAIRRVPVEVLAFRLREVIDVDCTDALLRCPAPILYLRGKYDVVVRPGALRLIQRIRRDVIVQTISAPHLLLAAQPKASWDCIRDFLQRVFHGEIISPSTLPPRGQPSSESRAVRTVPGPASVPGGD